LAANNNATLSWTVVIDVHTAENKQDFQLAYNVARSLCDNRALLLNVL